MIYVDILSGPCFEDSDIYGINMSSWKFISFPKISRYHRSEENEKY